MTDADVVHIGIQALTVAAKIAAPLMIISLVVGVVISLLQAVFSVQDQMLSMVPRLAVGALVLALTGNWMLRTLIEFTQQMFTSIPSLVH